LQFHAMTSALTRLTENMAPRERGLEDVWSPMFVFARAIRRWISELSVCLMEFLDWPRICLVLTHSATYKLCQFPEVDCCRTRGSTASQEHCNPFGAPKTSWIAAGDIALLNGEPNAVIRGELLMRRALGVGSAFKFSAVLDPFPKNRAGWG
ncbi:hypothetical protein C8R44DRAFT_603970, partial [Mycena epipterygia]